MTRIQKYAVNSDAVFHKCAAIEALYAYADTLRSSFGPWLIETLDIAMPLLTFYLDRVCRIQFLDRKLTWMQGIREAVAELLRPLLETAMQSALLKDVELKEIGLRLTRVFAEETDDIALV